MSKVIPFQQRNRRVVPTKSVQSVRTHQALRCIALRYYKSILDDALVRFAEVQHRIGGNQPELEGVREVIQFQADYIASILKQEE